MADVLRLSGSISVAPSSGSSSGHAATAVPLDEQLSVDHARPMRYTLASDAARVVDLDGLNVAFVIIRSTLKIKARFTSADGSQQIIPGTFIMVRSEDVPFTAIDLTRQPGVETIVDLTVGIAAS